MQNFLFALKYSIILSSTLAAFLELFLMGLVLLARAYETRCTIWYHFYNFKKSGKRPSRSVTFSTCNFTKSNTSLWVLFTFFKLREWY